MDISLEVKCGTNCWFCLCSPVGIIYQIYIIYMLVICIAVTNSAIIVYIVVFMLKIQIFRYNIESKILQNLPAASNVCVCVPSGTFSVLLQTPIPRYLRIVLTASCKESTVLREKVSSASTQPANK